MLDYLVAEVLKATGETMEEWEKGVAALRSQYSTEPEAMYQKALQDSSLDGLKQAKIDFFSSLCEADIVKGFTSQTTGHTYRFNRDDQFNMKVRMDEVKEDTTILHVGWKVEDLDDYAIHTREEFFAVVSEGNAHKVNNLTKYNSLKQQVKALTTKEEVESVIW